MGEYRKRPESNRPKMPNSQRAKQFAPFDALSGLSARLARAIEEHKDESEAKSYIHVDNSNVC